MSMHKEDWAKLGQGFLDTAKAHPTVIHVMLGFVLGVFITALFMWG